MGKSYKSLLYVLIFHTPFHLPPHLSTPPTLTPSFSPTTALAAPSPPPPPSGPCAESSGPDPPVSAAHAGTFGKRDSRRSQRSRAVLRQRRGRLRVWLGGLWVLLKARSNLCFRQLIDSMGLVLVISSLTLPVIAFWHTPAGCRNCWSVLHVRE